MHISPDKMTARVFFALWPSAPERRALADWQAGLQTLCGGRVMRPDTLHATLVFLGEVALDRLEALQLAAGEVRVAGFELCLDEARYWGHKHILYAAPTDVPPQLAKLVNDLERNLIAHRFPFEQREYQPHVTLLRNAHWRDDPLPGMPQLCWRVRDFVLLQSERVNGDIKYRVLARFPLLE